MKDRIDALSPYATRIFPYAIAVVFPLAGIVFAGAWAVDKRTYEATCVLGCAVVGILVYLTVFG